MSGVSALADAISDMGALTSLHVGSNGIPEKEMREIMAIAMRMDCMKILCAIPFKDKTLSELDVSGQNLGAEGALVVAEYLDGNGALTSLNLSSNTLEDKGAEVIAEAIKVTNCAIASFWYHFHAHLTTGYTAVVYCYPQDNGALTSLDISNQADRWGNGGIGAEGAKYLAEALKDHA
jgi:hypothetical protein